MHFLKGIITFCVVGTGHVRLMAVDIADQAVSWFTDPSRRNKRVNVTYVNLVMVVGTTRSLSLTHWVDYLGPAW